MDDQVLDANVPYFGGTDMTIPPTHVRPVHGRAGLSEPPKRLKLGEALVEAGVITRDQLALCLAEQAESTGTRRRIGEIVVDRGLATETDIAVGLSAMMGFEYVDPDDLRLDPNAVRRLPREVSERHTVLPLGAGATWLRVAMADPTDTIAIDTIRELTGVISVSIAISTASVIRAGLRLAWAMPADEPPAAAAPPAPAPAPGPPPPEPAAPAPVAPVAPVAAAVPAGDGWEYLWVGDGMSMDHAGYVTDQRVLDARLDDLGAQGWEAVGLHSNGTRVRVLLKRRR